MISVGIPDDIHGGLRRYAVNLPYKTVQTRYRPRIYRWFPENGSVCKLSGVNRYTWLHTNGWQPEADLRGLADAGQRHADLLLAIK